MLNTSGLHLFGLNSDTIEAPIARWDKDQLYKLTAITDKGCDSHSKILIRRFAGPELYIPTAFSPNGDGLNDVLRVFPVGIRTFHFFAVYNRYGQVLFQTTDYSKGWDGTVNGKKAEPGTYVAYATAIDYKGNPMVKKITVVLVR
jgi:gliding motility-associated-like protein